MDTDRLSSVNMKLHVTSSKDVIQMPLFIPEGQLMFISPAHASSQQDSYSWIRDMGLLTRQVNISDNKTECGNKNNKY